MHLNLEACIALDLHAKCVVSSKNAGIYVLLPGAYKEQKLSLVTSKVLNFCPLRCRALVMSPRPIRLAHPQIEHCKSHLCLLKYT